MSQVTPDPILQLLSSHMTAKYLFVANEVRLFETLAQEPMTLDDLAQRTGVPRRTLRIMVDALVATGFVEREDQQYRNGAVTATFLSGDPHAPDLRPILRLWNHIVYPQWLQLEESLRTEQATFGFADFSPEQAGIFSTGVEALTARSASVLAANYNFGRHQRVLDLGGGTGSFLFAALHQHPGFAATLFELPATANLVRQRLAEMPTAPAVQILEGNFLEDPLPQGYDAILLANVMHLFSPVRNRTLLQRVRQTVPTGARLLLVDFWTDATHTQPAFAALMAGEFQIVTGEGDVYSTDEVFGWLRESGWRPLEHKPLAGAASLIIAETDNEWVTSQC
jgi:SAM-dependent methyltransferase